MATKLVKLVSELKVSDIKCVSLLYSFIIRQHTYPRLDPVTRFEVGRAPVAVPSRRQTSLQTSTIFVGTNKYCFLYIFSLKYLSYNTYQTTCHPENMRILLILKILLVT